MSRPMDLTQEGKVLRTIRKRGHSAAQLGARFNIANPLAVLSRLRLDRGININKFVSVDTNGREVTKYSVPHR